MQVAHYLGCGFDRRVDTWAAAAQPSQQLHLTRALVAVVLQVRRVRLAMGLLGPLEVVGPSTGQGVVRTAPFVEPEEPHKGLAAADPAVVHKGPFADLVEDHNALSAAQAEARTAQGVAAAVEAGAHKGPTAAVVDGAAAVGGAHTHPQVVGGVGTGPDQVGVFGPLQSARGAGAHIGWALGAEAGAGVTSAYSEVGVRASGLPRSRAGAQGTLLGPRSRRAEGVGWGRAGHFPGAGAAASFLAGRQTANPQAGTRVLARG